MADAEGREVFAGIPRCQPSNGAVAFVLPYFSPDLERLGPAKRKRSNLTGGGEDGKRKQHEQKARGSGALSS